MDFKKITYSNYINRIKKEKIPCYEPMVGQNEIQNLKKVINSGWLSEKKFTRDFENFLATYCNRKYTLAFSNATSAMIVGMKALGIGHGDEVIVPSFSHSADANSISATGARPVFSEVSISSMCLTLDQIKQSITKKTKAILYVAVYGNADELDEIEKYCKRKKIFLIVDAAAALGSTFKKKHISSYGIFSVHSFFSDKTITTGEGGMLLTDNSKLLKTCNYYKHDGRKERGEDTIKIAGYNFRFTELQAAVGMAQTKKLGAFISRKKKIYQDYKKNLKDINQLSIFKYSKYCDPVPHRIVIFTKTKSNSLRKFLNQSGIGVRQLFMPMHRQPLYNLKKQLKNSEILFNTGICLPSAPKLKDRELNFVCNKIKKFFN